MLKSLSLLFFLLFNLYFLHGQTTDLSITIEAQDLNGNAISQVDIYEDFQYVITVLNSGNSVDNSTISVSFDTDLIITSFNSQNSNAGASEISNINSNNNVLSAVVATMPNNSSVELLVLVTAPTNLGGIATNGTVSPPINITDTNTSNNQSIISIDVLDIIIDFSVTHTQIQPVLGTSINAWGDTVTYRFTITNNSAISFPISSIEGNLILTSAIANGQPFVEFTSLECIETTNGTLCPDLSGLTGNSTVVSSTLVSNAELVFNFSEDIEITANGSVTFEMIYQYSNLSCSINPMQIEVDSFIEISLDHTNTSSNMSNFINTDLLNADVCSLTDVCIETVQTNPDTTEDLLYEQEITFVTTICNAGGVETPMRFFLQNLSAFSVSWDIISVNCIGTSGPILCSDFSISDNDQLWTSNDFVLQPNTTITIETVIKYIEPICSTNPNSIQTIIRSGTNILDSQLLDSNPENNFFANLLELPSVDPCDISDISDLQVTKTQVYPELPIGSSLENTTEWGLVTYDITITNVGDNDAIIEVQDYMPIPNSNATPISAMLTSVECLGTTGDASCYNIENANIGVLLNGFPENDDLDIFWQIQPEDNWELPANSSVSFSVSIEWFPECSSDAIIGTNAVVANYVNNILENDSSNNSATVSTYFAPCIDLIVQTYPEFTQVNTNETFSWIVDISNSITSSMATDVLFENTLNPVFNSAGTPICTVTSGNATSITNFNIVGNFISGVIPNMEAGSTVTISIPVTAPNYGGAFNNIAEAIPNSINNEEITPDTNISINSVQVVAPILQKSFMPNTIIEGGESELSFTIFNIASNPTQANISFIDNLPNGVTLSGPPNWIQSNGATATFLGNIGDAFVGVDNLVFPEGVASCTFSVTVTSNIIGMHLNNFENFSNANNIDTSQASATLNVIIDTSDVDIEINKTVMPMEVTIGENVVFTITATNIGTTSATLIEILDALPSGYEFVSASTSFGVFNELNSIWNMPSLDPNTSQTLTLTAKAISSNNLTNIASLNSVNEPDRNMSNNEDDATVAVSNCLSIPEGISPNNDGKNDVLIIPCIEDYPENSLQIYNRYGKKVFETSNYLNTWDGRANIGFPKSSQILPIGTYYYILEIKDFKKAFVGYVYLNY